MKLTDLPDKRNCMFFDELPEEKLSGGIYRQRSGCRGESFNRYFAVVYLLAGDGSYRDYLNREFEINTGDLIIRHAEAGYRITRGEGWTEFAAALPASLYRAMRQAHILEADMTLLRPGLDSQLILLASEYIHSLDRADSRDGRCRSYGLMMEFLSNALRLANHESERWLEQAKKILGSGFEQPLDMRRAAAELGMGYENFRKQFREQSGLSPNEYRIRRRLDQADALLLHTDLPIKEIAAQLGYSAVSSFTRQYAIYRGHAPGQNRNH